MEGLHSMKRVLFLSANFPPLVTRGSSRAARIASRLPEIGWEPLVVAPPDVVHAESDSALGVQQIPGRVVRTGEAVAAADLDDEQLQLLLHGCSATVFSGSGLGKIVGFSRKQDLVSGWERGARRLIADIMTDTGAMFDAIYAQGPPLAPLLLALELSGKHGVSLLFDLVAPFEGRSGSGTKNELAKAEEKIVTSGHPIITPTRDLKEYFLKKYFGRVTHRDISILPDIGNACEMVALREVPTMTVLADHATKKSTKLFFSVLGRSLKSFGGFVISPVQIRFCGGDPKQVARYSRIYLPSEITTLTLPKLQGGDIRRSSVFVVLQAVELESMLTLPSIALDALCMGTPLFVIGPDGPASRLAVETGGVFAPYEDTDAIERLFGRAFGLLRGESPVPVPVRVSERFSAPVIMDDLSKLLAYLLPV